jgi:methyl-accepting chemotaxis protein
MTNDGVRLAKSVNRASAEPEARVGGCESVGIDVGIDKAANNVRARRRSDHVGRVNVLSADVGVVSADAAEDATRQLSITVAAVSELGASVAEIAGQAARSSAFAMESVGDVNQAAEQISRLNAASTEIHAVSEMIRSIAHQTNLLALNASIEAARAGDAGRGFAVVAGEVKQLANQTAAATEGIARQIAAIQGESVQAVAAIARVRSSIHAISDNTSGIAAAVEEQRASTDEINRTLDTLNERMSGVSLQIRSVTGGAILTCANSIEVLWTARSLSSTSKDLGDDAKSFLTSIAAE